MKKVASLLALILALCFFTGVLSACKNTEEKALIIGFLEDSSPLSYLDDDGLPSGFDISLAEAVFDKLGLEVEFKAVSYKDKEKALASKQIDMLWGGIIKTDELSKQFLLSNVYLNNSILVAVRKDSLIGNVDDIPSYALIAFQEDMAKFVSESDALGGKVTKTESGYTYDSAIKITVSAKAALNGLKDGLYTAAVADMLSIKNYNETETTIQVKPLSPAIGTNGYVIALRKGETDLLSKITQALYELQQTGYLSNLAAQMGVTEALTEIDITPPAEEE